MTLSPSPEKGDIEEDMFSLPGCMASLRKRESISIVVGKFLV
jgi:hypothetical protein